MAFQNGKNLIEYIQIMFLQIQDDYSSDIIASFDIVKAAVM